MNERARQFRALYRELRIADQRRFYEARSREYENAHRQAMAVRDTLLALAAVLGILAQLFIPPAGKDAAALAGARTGAAAAAPIPVPTTYAGAALEPTSAAGSAPAGRPRGAVACGVAAAVLAALAGAVTAFEALIGFAQLRKLYGDAALSVAEAEIEWDALPPDDGSLAAELERVEQIFRCENGQWGQLVVESSAKAAPHSARDQS